jgi:hypothetical protein
VLQGLLGLVLVGTVGAAVPQSGAGPGGDPCAEACEEPGVPGDAVVMCQGIEVGPAPPVALVMSGGISAGVYLAGQAHVVVEHLRRVEDRRQALLGELAAGAIEEAGCKELRALGSRQDVVITGASAGTVSALSAFVTLLQPGLDMNPEDSVFFSIWMQLGIDQSPSSMDHVPRGADGGQDWLFTLEGLDPIIDQLRLAFKPENRTKTPWSGDIRIGFTTTRVEPTQERGGLYVQAKEAWALEWASGAEAPRWLRQRGGDGEQALDDLTIGQEHLTKPMQSSELEALVELVKASGAFPLAFKPRTVSCDFHNSRSYYRTQCPVGEAEIGFIDGGFFDNNPGALGAELACKDWGKLAGDSSSCEPILLFPDPDLAVNLDGSPLDGAPVSVESKDGVVGNEDEAPEEPVRLPPKTLLQDLDTKRRDSQKTIEEQQAFESLFGFFGDFIPVVQNLGLADYYRENPRAVAVPMPQRTRPASTRAGAFLGFFDRTLRAWDFYAGMYDAMVSVEESLMPEHDGERYGGPDEKPFLPDVDPAYGQHSYYRAVRDSFEAFFPQLDGRTEDSVASRLITGLSAASGGSDAVVTQGSPISVEEARGEVRRLVRAHFATVDGVDAADPADAFSPRVVDKGRGDSGRATPTPELRTYTSCGTYPYVLWTPGAQDQGPRAAAYCSKVSERMDAADPAEAGTSSQLKPTAAFDPFRFEPPRPTRLQSPELMIGQNFEVLTFLALEEQLRLVEYPAGRCEDGEAVQALEGDKGAARHCAVQLQGHDDTWYLTELSVPQWWCPAGGTTCATEDRQYVWFTPFDLDDHIGDHDPWASLLRRRLYYTAYRFVADDLNDSDSWFVRNLGSPVSRWALQAPVGDSFLRSVDLGTQGVGLRFHKYGNRPTGWTLTADHQVRRPQSGHRMKLPRAVFGGGLRYRPGVIDQSMLMRADVDLGLAFRWNRAGLPHRDELFFGDRVLSFEPALYVGGVFELDSRTEWEEPENGLSAVAGGQLTFRVVDLIGVKIGLDTVSWDLVDRELGWFTLRSGRPASVPVVGAMWGAIEITLPPAKRDAPYGMTKKQQKRWTTTLDQKAKARQAEARKAKVEKAQAEEPPAQPEE